MVVLTVAKAAVVNARAVFAVASAVQGVVALEMVWDCGGIYST
jgi:hypothetical protein